MRLLVAVLVAMVGMPAALGLQSARLLTSASAVRLRAQPAADAGVIADLPLGTELTRTSEARGGWVAVTADGRSGFVSAALTRQVDPARRLDVVTSIARARMARSGDGVRARTELVEFLERERTGTQGDAAAALDLLRLRALDQLVTDVPLHGQTWPAPWDRWLDARSGELWYNEVGGRFIVRREAILATHERHRGTASADDIFWFAHDVGIGGECEGSISCYAERVNLLAGDYLRAYPAGRHVREALSGIDRHAAYWLDDIVPTRIFQRDHECPRLPEPLALLRGAVVAVADADRDRTLARLDQAAAICK